MRDEHWLIAVSLLVLAGLGWAMGEHTHILAQAQRVAQLQAVIAERDRADAAALRLSSPLAEYAVSSPVGIRQSPLGGGEEGLHKGVDLVGPHDCAVLASAPGVVVDHWLSPGVHNGKRYSGHSIYGGLVVLDHGGGVYTLYGHLGETLVHIGDRVERGQQIGVQGNTGASTAEHLHWEVVRDPMAGVEEKP